MNDVIERSACDEEILKLVNKRLSEAGYAFDELGIYRSGIEGYWSNLDRNENKYLLDLLKMLSPREALREAYPAYENIIFSSKRDAALELLDIKLGEKCVDYGCMWGALSIGMAKRGGNVFAFDQTYESLVFLNYRKKHEKLNNITLIQDDVKNINLEGFFDCSLINGVLEWIPEVGEVDLKMFYGKKYWRKESEVSPREMQLRFLKRVCHNLRLGGRLLLAIENRYDFTHFIGKRDPHSALFLTAVLPRPIADLISKIILNRPYVNYIYSFKALKKLLCEAGFNKVELYMALPNYHFPELILPYDGGAKFYQPYSTKGCSWKRRAVTLVERLLIKYFRAKALAPSIVAVAKK